MGNGEKAHDIVSVLILIVLAGLAAGLTVAAVIELAR